jgi:hypothetical protein
MNLSSSHEHWRLWARRTPLRLISVMTVLLALLAGSGIISPDRALAGAGPETSAIVRCEPMVAAGPPGQPLVVALYVENVAGLYGVEMELSFDPTIAQVVDADPVTPGVQIQPLGSFLSPDFVVMRGANNSTGIIDYAATQIFPQAPVSGSGPVAAVTFQSVTNGTFSMPYIDALLVDIDGAPIPAIVLPCAVQFQPLQPCYDFDNNGVIDVVDVMAVTVRWPLTASNPDPDNNPVTPNYEPLYDVNGDRAITVLDIQMVAERWLQSCGPASQD